MKMASEYDCGKDEEDTLQLKQCEFDEYHMGNTAPYMTENLSKKVKANVRKEVVSIEVYKIITK